MANEKEKTFLTPKEVLAAIRIDFKQYDTQFSLFQELCPLITDNRKILVKDGRDFCVLISRGRKSKMRRINDSDLGPYLYNMLKTTSFSLPILAQICNRVFQTPAYPGKHEKGGYDGIWIETDMKRFICRQCGYCCQNLNYHNDCTQNDYERWQLLGRDDITERVKIIRTNDKPARYQIWIEPGTRQATPECPWLKKDPSYNLYHCAIQDIKPEFCRQYPLTRKHADMTGCKGSFKNRS
jgi:Fe-S-cluster containining protein